VGVMTQRKSTRRRTRMRLATVVNPVHLRDNLSIREMRQVVHHITGTLRTIKQEENNNREETVHRHVIA